MRSKLGCLAALTLGAACSAQAADLPTKKAPPLPSGVSSCSSLVDFATTDCPLTWYGITFYGTIDVGGGWESHGTPFNPVLSTGVEELVSKNSNHGQWLPTPNGLSQSNIGVKGKEEFLPGWSFVFDLNAGFDPYSLQPANSVRALVENDGVALAKQNSNADSSRAGQFYNGAGYAGISNKTFGTLTFGRQNSLTLDGVNFYDPMGGSYAFSPIGYSGATAGVGDTEDARYTTALKYRVEVGMLRAAGLYQFGGYDLGNASQDSFQVQLGGDIDGGPYGKLSLDGIYSRDNDAVSAATLSAAQNIVHPGSLAVTLSDDTSEMLLAKYTFNQFKLSGGYEHISFTHPSDPQFASFTTLGNYTAYYTGVGGQINNTNYATDNRILNIMWVGGRYAFTDTLDAGVAYYHYDQPSWNTVRCSSQGISSKCSGTLDAVSFDVDWKFEKKFDVYAGLMFSQVGGGLANGYLYRNNVDPTVGLRFRF